MTQETVADTDPEKTGERTFHPGDCQYAGRVGRRDKADS